MTNDKTSPVFKIILLIGLVGLVLVLGLIAVVRQEQHAAIGGEIQYDDFGFQIVKATTADELGVPPSTASAKGCFHRITLQVNNHAKRVPFKLTGWRPLLTDGDGNEYEVDTAGQKALEAQLGAAARLDGEIAAGQSIEKTIVYDLPEAAHDVRFKISWGGDVIDTVDFVICGERDIALQ